MSLDVSAEQDLRHSRALKLLDTVSRYKTSASAALPFLDENFEHVQRALLESDYECLSELGLDIEYLWLDDVVAALVNNEPFVEIEISNPKVMRNFAVENKSQLDQLGSRDQTELLLTGFIQELISDCDNACAVLPVEDSDFDLSDNHSSITKRQHQQINIDELVKRLRTCNNGVVEEDLDGDVTFFPLSTFVQRLSLESERRQSELRSRGILLMRNGLPTSHASEAESLLGLEHREVLYVVFADHRLASQQDKAYALLRAIGIVAQEQHHNVFFDADKLSPHLIVYAICELFEREIRRSICMTDRMDSWSQFDPHEYVTRNYTSVVPEDRMMIHFVLRQLAESKFSPGSATLVADVGAGPNLYPAMLLAPYVSDEGAIESIEYGERNRDYANAVISDHRNGGAQPNHWALWEESMISSGGDRYIGAFSRACELTSVRFGSIFSLPVNRYDIVTSYFCADSITTSRREFWMAIRSLRNSLKPGGLLITAHTVGSRSYSAGVDTHFPAVNLNREHIEQAYRDAGFSFTAFTVGEDETVGVPGTTYHGMICMVARRRHLQN